MEMSFPEQQIIDNEHLRVLRLAYFISGATAGLFACLGLLYILLGATFVGLMDAVPQPGAPSPEMSRWFFIVFGFVFVVIGGALAALRLYVARCLRLRKSLWLCFLVAAISCLDIPWGTALGVFTFVLLGRPSVRAMFEGTPPDDHQVLAADQEP